MLPLSVLALTALMFWVPDVHCRPKDQSHNGLYDEWKTVPFVDNPEHTGDMFGEYVTKLGNSDNTNKMHDKYSELYDKYNQEHDRVIGDGNSSDARNDTNESENEVDDDIKDVTLVEGGTEDMASEWSADKVRKGRKHRRDRENKRKHRHHKSVKKDLSEDEKKEKELKRERKRKERKNRKTKATEEVDTYTEDDLDIEKFYQEHPDFKKNVATISDIAKEDNVSPSTTNTFTSTSSLVDTTTEKTDMEIPEDSQSEDDADQKDADDFDKDDDLDDDEEKGNKESESEDESSEAFNDYYDYYDEDGDSSYSSSEQRAEQEMLHQTPYDWFQNYDRMYGDQPVQTESQSKKSDDDSKVSDVKEKENTENKKFVKEDNNIPKTDVEPSTSPNPPTPKKDIKSTVTQPAYPEWKERVETWNLIESKPVEACKENADCPSGRMCKFGLCLCGQPDFCEGHYKPVCGSDGRLYPSHCELHRTACVLGVHIRLDHESRCGIKVDGLVEVTKEDKSTIQATSVNDPETEETLETTTIIPIDETSSLAVDDKKDTAVEQKIDTTLQKAFDSLKAEEEKKAENNINEDNNKESDISKDVNVLMNQEPVQKSKGESSATLDVESDDDDDVDSNDDDDASSNSIEEKTFNTNFDYDSSEAEYDEEDYDDSDDYDDDDYDDVDDDDSDSDSSDEESTESSEKDKPSLVPLFCTPDRYMKFKADVLEYHCIFLEEQHCDRQTQEEKQKLAAVMFNYFDKDLSSFVEKEELWEMQLLERMDELSSLCTLLDIVTFDELGERDGKLSVDEFIQAFDIPDLLEHKTEVVPLLATVGNGLEVKCDITDSTDIVWLRNDIDLSLIDFPGISVLGDGSLYLETVGFHHVGNLSCHDRQKPSIKQIHMLTVQKPPHVTIHLDSHDQVHGVNFEIRCHAEGYPKPTVSWVFEDQPIKQGAKYHVQSYDNTLIILDPDYVTDSGVYKCLGKNTAGESIASVSVTVHSLNDTKNIGTVQTEESFVIFHDNGYTMHEPEECVTQRHVLPEFGNFYFIPDELDNAPSLCENGIPCVWGAAVNVRDTFVFVTQPRQNRVVVIDVEDTFNPNQVIFTDHMPVSIHYVAHLDEVWVLCWNGEEDNGAKTVVIIRNASQRTQHHAIHTQPIGNRFDQVQEIFLPEDSELHHPYKYGYTVHSGQQGLFKVNLEEKKYTRAVDFTKYDCVPKSVAFVPLGGHSLIQCVKKTSTETITHILTMDYITDTVIDNITLSAVPYVSPDVRNVVMVMKETGRILVHQVTENGEIIHQFDVTVGSPVGQVTFHKGRYSHGYDLYLTSTQYPQIYAVSLENGKVDIVKDIGQPDTEMFLPWFTGGRPLVSGDLFSNFLGTTAMSSMLILNGRHHSIQCDYMDLDNPAVVTYTRVRT